MDILRFFGIVIYPATNAALLMWLGYTCYRLYRSWASGQLTTDAFYAWTLRAGATSLSLLALMLYLSRYSRAYPVAATMLAAAAAQGQSLPNVRLPGSSSGGNVFDSFTNFVVYGGRILVILLVVAGICGISWQIISSFVQARNNSDWGRFGATFITGAIVLLFLVALGQFAWSYLESLGKL